MADKEGSPLPRAVVPEPASDAKKHASKLVVLSSVAKVPPQKEAESLLGEPDPSEAGKRSVLPPPLPRKPGEEGMVRPVGWTIRPGGTTTIIKLPPKTGVLPRLTSLSTAGSRPEAAPLHHAPPPLPSKREEPLEGEEETKRLPPVKLHLPTGATPQDSFLVAPADQGAPTVPPPLAVKKGGAKPPPLPPRPIMVREDAVTSASLINPSLKKMTTVLRSKAVRGPDAQAEVPPSLQATTLLSPAPLAIPVSEAKLPSVSPAPPVPAPPGPPIQAPVVGTPSVSRATGPVMRLPPRLNPAERTAVPAHPAATVTPSPAEKTGDPAVVAKPEEVVHPPKAFSGTAPTLPIALTARVAAARSEIRPVAKPVAAVVPATPDPDGKTASQLNRAARLRKRHLVGIIGFYILLIGLVPCLYFAALYFSQETRVEGQVIPPAGMVLGKEAWIVTDFRDLASGIASDLGGDRAMVMQEMQEKLDHVHRAQRDVAAREERIRLLKEQIQAANDEQLALVKQARDASQQVWDGPGAQLEADYKERLAALNEAIADRAKSLGIKYAPDPNFFSPEVWANAFRLGLYEVPKGVDPVKERLWLEAQMKDWRDFTKSMDDKQNSLREQAVQLKMAPAPRIADLKTQIDDLQQRIDGTIAEEEPLKAELEQAQTDLAVVQAKEAGLDDKPYEKLYALPEANITKRLPLQSNGRFSWRELEKENKYAEDEKSHAYWLFTKATRPDGRQYWALHRFTIAKDSTVLLIIEPEGFLSAKAILRPDLSPDEQAQ